MEFGVDGFAGDAGLMVAVNEHNRLLKADGDEQADADGGDVDEEVFPRVGSFERRMDVEHGSLP